MEYGRPTFEDAVEGMTDIAVYHAARGTSPDVVERVFDHLVELAARTWDKPHHFEVVDRNLDRLLIAEKKFRDARESVGHG